MTRIWTRKLTLLKLGVVLVLMGVLGVVVMDTRPASAATMVTVSAGDLHTCAVTTTGGVKCWGYNNSGQLGDGTNTDNNVPVDVSGLTSGMTAVSAGDRHTCALTTTGGIKCWGFNFSGQLGDGTTTSSNVPVDVSGLASGVSVVSAGAAHTCALTGTGGIKCWGINFDGQLGAGALIDTNTPVAVHIPFTLEDHDARIMAALDGLSIGGGGDTSTALAAIQAKLDADLDAAVTTRSSQSSVDALGTAVASRSSQSSVDALGTAVASRSSQSSVDALGTALSDTSSQTSVDALSIRMDELEAKLDEILGLLSTPGSSPGGPPGGPGGGPGGGP
ncbi:MAG: hypothetical protein IIB25_03570 [Chloroflexi bacterium]|nr:hypothetical protein [Chloroflexota bacterium]